MTRFHMILLGFTLTLGSVACSFGVELTKFFEGSAVMMAVDAGTSDAYVPVDGARERLQVGPAPQALEPGAALQLTATTASGSPVVDIAWSIQEGTSGGSIDTSGLYKAPYAAGAFHVIATAGNGAQGTVALTVPPGIALLAGRVDGYVDGPGKDARFRFPSGSAVDAAGNVYISERIGHTIRKITPAGVVSTLAGLAGVSGSADGVGSAARFRNPNSVAVDSIGNVYVADSGNVTIRKISPAGAVTTLAGEAGRGGFADGIGTAARFSSPAGVAADSLGNVFVSDNSSCVIRKISSTGQVTTVAGTPNVSGSADGSGSGARFNAPESIASDAAGMLYVTDNNNHTIRVITQAGVVTTLAGTAGQPGYADGIGAAARFLFPSSIAVDSTGTLFVADFSNNVIRRITQAGVVSTFAGSYGRAQSDGPAGGFFQPYKLSIDSAGTLYVAEYSGQTIRKVSPSSVVSTLAGLAIVGDDDGDGSAASFRGLEGIAIDSDGNAYVSDYSAIRKITPSGAVTTWAGKKNEPGSVNGVGEDAGFYGLKGLAFDKDNDLYIADGLNFTVRKVATDRTVTTVAGLAGNPGATDGAGAIARFGLPIDIAVDAAKNLHIADYNNHTIRLVNPSGTVSTIAGMAGTAGSADGAGSSARFQYPKALALDSSGNLIVADGYNHTIRRVAPSGAVTTIGGAPGVAGYVDGTSSLFHFPWALAADTKGNVFIGENGNRDIRRMTAAGVSKVAGTTLQQYTSLAALPGSFFEVTGIAVQPSGTILFTTQHAVYRIVGGY